jgi:hypothetical protein
MVKIRIINRRLLSVSIPAFVMIAVGLSTPSANAQNKPALDFPLSQTPTTSPPRPLNFNPPSSVTQGNQVIVNGRSFSANWSQWQAGGQARLGLADAALTQIFGIDLSNTADVGKQPIQWFSNLAASVLPTRLTPPLRFLDITDFARQNGWQLQVSGTALQITTPPARIAEIRQGQPAPGDLANPASIDRIVIDLDRSTPWQVDPQPDELVLTLDAQTDPSLLKAFKPNPASRIRSLKIETNQNQTIVRVGIPFRFRPQITTVANPDRILIDVGANYLASKDILWANGLRWRQQYLTVGTSQLPVVWFEINPRQAGLAIRPILPNGTSVTGTAPLINTARTTLATAAINGGYFNRNNQLPLGMVRFGNRLMSGPILNRGAVGWDDNGNWRFDRLSLQETIALPSGQRLPLTTLNSAYIQAGIARYTPDWGSTYTTLSDNETLLTVQNNQVTAQQNAGPAGTSFPLPTTGYVLVFRSNRTAANSFPIGTAIQLESVLTPQTFNSLPNIIGGGPLLIQNGQMVLDAKSERFSDAFIRETAARSAIGQTADGRILIASVHNQTAGTGATLSDIAEIMRQLGAVNAVNLDGGSSTTLYLGGQLLDRPPRTSARVHNGIGIFLEP